MKKILIALLILSLSLMTFTSCDDTPNEEGPVVRPPSVWDGESSDTTWYNEEATTYSIETASQLKGLSDLVAEGTSFAGKTINLEADIDLKSFEWTPIGDISRTKENDQVKHNWFDGNFDGKNHKIMNLSIRAGETDDTVVGFFGGVRSGEIKNLIIESGSVENLGDTAAGVVGAYLGEGNFTISNCVNKASVNAGDTAAGIIGRIYGTGTANVSNCINHGNVEAPKKAGGIAGINSKGTVTIDACENHGKITSELTGNGNGNGGGILGLMNRNCTVLNSINYGDVNAAQASSGIVGMLQAPSKEDLDKINIYKIEQCVNNGNITGPYSVGGIIGLAGGAPGYEVKNCVNNGAITSEYAAGGIIGGASKGSVTFTECKNTAVITATKFAGGIAGSLQEPDVTLDKCSGGKAEITAEYPGRLIGTGESGSGDKSTLILDDNNGDSYENSLRTVGCFSDGTSLPIWVIEQGTLYGVSPVIGAQTAQITFKAGTTWVKSEEETITFSEEKTFHINKDGLTK